MIKKLTHSHLLKKFIFLLMLFCAAEYATAQITTAADDTSVETYSAPSSDPRALAWAKNSTRLYIAGNSTIYEYTVGTTISSSESFATSEANNVINVKTLGDGSATQAYDVDDITGLAFSDDGQYLYFVGVGGVDDDYINQLYLSTAWDLSTAGRLSTSRRLISGFSIPQDIQFNGDGTKAYVLAADDLKIYEFELDAPYSINSSTPSPGGSANELFITGEANPSGFSFNANGSRLFVAGNGGDRITEYYLPDLYEISTAVIGASFFLLGTQIEAIAVNRYDHKILVLDNTSNSLFQYSFNGYPTTSSVTPDQTNNPDKSDVRFRVTFSENVTGFGTRNMIVVKTGTVTYGNISVSKTNTTGSGANSYYVDLADVTGNGSLKIDIKEANTGGVKDYDGEPLSGAYTTGKVQAIGSAFSVLSASYRVSDYFDVNEVVSGATITWDVKVSDDGSKLFVLDRTLDRVLEFTLSTPNDITTATYNGDLEALSLTGIETTPSGMSFQSDGSKLFILGELVDGITEFSLSTPYDVSTASFVRSTAVSPSNNANDGFDFSSDGMKVFIAREGSTDVIAEYNLPAPYDITTITATGVEFDINPYETGVRDLEIVNDGRFMIVVGQNSEIIHTIELTTPNDLSTATYREDYALSTIDREDQMLGIGFSMLGDWMYVIGSDEIVYSYSLNKAPFIRNFAISEDYNPSSSQGVIEIEFSESVSGFTADDLEIEHFGSATGELGTLTGSEELYELTISGIDGEGAIVVSIKEDSGISDLLGTSYTGGSTAFMVGTVYNFEQAVESGDFDLDDEDTTPNGITFNATGDKMYILGGTGDDVNVYDLSTYFDVTTAVYKPSETLVLSDISDPDKILFHRYGTKLFVRNNSNSSLHEYSLSTPFDVSTAQYAGLSESLDNFGGDSFAFNNDGTVLFGGSSNGRIFSFPLDLAYDISSNTAGQTEEIDLPIAISDFRFDLTGRRLIVATTSNPDRIVTYYLDAPYNVSSAVEAHEDLSLPFSNPLAFSFDNYGNRLFIIDNNDFVKQYDFNQKPEVLSFEEFEDEQHGYAMKLQFSEPISGVDQSDFNLVASSGVSAYSWSVYHSQTENTIIRIYALGDGTIEVSLKESGTDIVDLKGADLIPKPAKLTAVLGSAFDVAQASYLGTENSYTITEETSPTSFTFNNEGSKMYVTGASSDDLHEYNLSTPYDLTTVAFGQTFDLAISNPSEITFNSDGSKLFVLDPSEVIHEYSLSTSFDISSASYQGVDDTYVVYSEDTSPQGITFNHDGTIMYMLGDSGNDINAYSLSTPYDISRATSLGSDFGFSVSAEETSPQDLQFSADGKRLLVVGNSGLDINQYSVATPWDITTATYLGDEYRLDLSTDMTSPGSMAFSADGTKLFVLSTDTGVIHSYDLNAAPVVTSFALAGEYPKNFPEAHYILTFDEPVTGVTIDDLEIITTGTASAQINELTSAGVPYIHYNISLTSLSGVGTVAINLKETDTGIIDLVGKGIETSYMSEVHEVDRVAPTATISIDDTALKIGDTPTVTITFSEEVTGFDIADLIFENGELSNFSTSDDITFTATFTPTSDVEDTENIITLDMSELTDLAGNAGVVDASTETFEIDTKRPDFSDFDVFDVSGSLEAGTSFSSLFSFSEVVTGFDPSNFTVPHGSFSDVALYQSFENTYTYTYTIPGGVESDLNVIQFDLSTITDLAGNPGVGIFSTENFIIDTNPPTFTIALDDETLTIGETTTVTYTFSEPMFLSPTNTGLEFEINFTTPNGSVSDLAFTEGTTTLTFTFSPNVDVQDYTNEIFSSSIALVDGIKSDGTEGFNTPFAPSQTKSPNYIVDNVMPTLTVDIDDSIILTEETATVTFTFSEAVSGFDNSDITFSNGTLSDVATSDDITFTAVFTPEIGLEEATNVISVINTLYTDLAGNAGEGSSESPNFEINTVVPTLVISIDDTNLILDETATVTFNFSEAVTEFDNDDITVPNGELTAVSSSDGGITFTATFTPTPLIEALENVIFVDNTGFEDLSGNTGIGTSETENFTIDGVIPTVNVAMSDDGLIADETSDVTFTFSEPVVGFDNADITAEQGTLTDVVSEDGGITFTALFTPTPDFESTEDYFITVDQAGVEDVRGNVGSGTRSGPSYDIETLRPTVVITMADKSLIAGETTTVTFAFSEKVGSPSEAISAENGIIDADPSSNDGLTYTAAFVPSDDFESLENLVSVDMSILTDQAGNAGMGVTSLNYSIDTKEPTLTITMDDLYLLDGETAVVTFEFSEEVLDFTSDDIVSANGSISDLSSTNNIQFMAVFTPDEELAEVGNAVSVEGSSYTDLAGNPGVELSESAAFEINTVIPVITFEALTSKTYGDDAFALSAIVTSEDEVVFSSSNPEVASIENNTVTILAAGSTIITASQPADENTNAAIPVEQTLTVNQATLTVAAEDKAKIYGESNPELTFTYDGFVNSDDESVLTEHVTVTTVADETSEVGNYVIGVAGGSADNYVFVYMAGDLSIAQKELIASAEDKAKTYGSVNPELTIEYAGFENGDDAADIIEPAIATTATVDSGVGVYPITLSDGAAVNYSIQLVNAELTINPADLLISADNQVRAYGEENPALTITYDGFVVDETSDDLDVAPVISTEATIDSNVGQYSIVIGEASDENYAISYIQGSLTIEKADQMIDFATVTEIDLLTENTITLTATASSGLDVTYALTQGDGSIDGNVITANKSGTFEVTASQVGNGNYNPVSVSQVFNVNDSRKDNQTITFGELANKTYGDAAFSLTASASSSLDVVYVATGPASISGSELTITGAGVVTITAQQAGDDIFNPAPSVVQSFTVAKATLSINANDATRAYGLENPEFGVTYSGFVGADDQSGIDTAPVVETSANELSDVGTYAITVGSAADNNYDFNYTGGALTITKATLTVTATEASKVFGADNPVFAFSYDGFLNGDNIESIDTAPIATTSATILSDVGEYEIAIAGASDNNYDFVYAKGTFTITKAMLTVKVDDTSKVYGTDNPDFTFTYTGFVNGNDASVIDTKPTVSTPANAASAVGEYALTASSALDNNYDFTYFIGSLNVTQASLQVIADDKSSVFGDAIPELTISYSGFAGADIKADLDALPTVATTATATSDAGTYTIDVLGGSDNNYTFDYQVGTLTIEKANQTINFASVDGFDIATQTTVTLSATASSGLDVVYNLVQGDGTISGAVLTVNASGTFMVEASQAGNGNYNGVSASQSFNVVDSRKTDQTIIFEALGDKTYGDASFTLTATATSSLDVIYTASGSVSISGTEVTILGAGQATITAIQSGDDTFNPAQSVSQSFTIAKAALNVTAEDQMILYGEAIPDLTMTYSGFVGTDASADLDTQPMINTTATATSDAGTYTIDVSGGSDNNYTFDYQVGTLTIEKANQTINFASVDGFDIATQTTVTLSATASSGLDVVYNLVQGDGTISGAVLTVNASGTFIVEASQAGDGNYNGASASQTISVNDSRKTDQTITFGTLADKTYGDASFILAATASSSLDVIYTASGSVSISGTEVTILGAGQATITAIQSGDDTFNPAQSVSQSFTIAKAALIVTAEDQMILYGEAIPDLTMTYSGFVGTDASADLDTQPMINTTATATSDAGTYMIDVTGGSDNNYTFDYQVGTLTIEKANQTINFASVDGFDIATQTTVTLSATASSGLDVVYNLVQGDGTISGAVLTVNASGTFIVEASQAGDGNYNGASASQTFSVNDSRKTDQTITFNAISSARYGDVFTLGASASSGLSVSYSVASGPASLSGNEVTLTGVGEVSIVATQNGNTTFNPAQSVTQIFTVAKASLTATADDKSIVFGDALPALTIRYTGFVNGESATDLDAQVVIETDAVATSDAGAYTISISGGASSNYELSYTAGTLTIEKATASITVTDLNHDVDGSPKEPTISTDPAGLTFTVTFDGSAIAPAVAGSYEVVVTIDEANYKGSETATLVLNDVLAVVPKLSIRTYPNPAIHSFQVEANADLKIEVYSMSGVLELVSVTNNQIDISRLAEGVYLIRVLDARGRSVKTQQLIKQ